MKKNSQNFDIGRFMQTVNTLKRLPFFRGKGLISTVLVFVVAAALVFFGGGTQLLSKFGLHGGQTQLGSPTAHSVNSVPSNTFKAKVIRVSDGDTIVVETPDGQQVKIRVLGMDTPEKYITSKLKKDAAECHTTVEKMSYLGKLASKHAHEYLKPEDIVVVEPHGQGKYGRLLAKIYVNGKDYALQMIRDGYSCVYKSAAPKEYFRALEEAKEKRTGLWKDYYKIMNCLCK